VLTGEDALLLPLLCSGADGGILASAHIATERFVAVARLVAANDHRAARAAWAPLARFIPKLFQEANPMPIKYCLWRQGLIASPECRSPLGAVSAGLAAQLDAWLRVLAAGVGLGQGEAADPTLVSVP
jgi:4-hydroxy-tetrahydrodipicolinate synthase